MARATSRAYLHRRLKFLYLYLLRPNDLTVLSRKLLVLGHLTDSLKDGQYLDNYLQKLATRALLKVEHQAKLNIECWFWPGTQCSGPLRILSSVQYWTPKLSEKILD